MYIKPNNDSPSIKNTFTHRRTETMNMSKTKNEKWNVKIMDAGARKKKQIYRPMQFYNGDKKFNREQIYENYFTFKKDVYEESECNK